MAIEAQVRYECDKCGAVREEDLDEDARATDKLPTGWGLGEYLELLCDECLELEEEQSVPAEYPEKAADA
jgi:hypothetical protein